MQARRPTRTSLAVSILLTTLAFTPLVSEAGLLDGLVAYWSFDTDFQATVGSPVYDAVPYNGPVIDPAGRYGPAAYFTRANLQYLDVTAPVLAMGQDHTYSAWYRSTVEDIVDGDRHFVLETRNATYDNCFAASYGLRDYGAEDVGQVYTQWGVGSMSRDIPGAGGTDWHNIIVTYDADNTGAEHAIYLDGAFVNTMPSFNPLVDTAGLIIGACRLGTDRNWDGWIDDVAFWDRVLTSEEIAAVQDIPVEEGGSTGVEPTRWSSIKALYR